jgi:alkanesulfonate monooxygenase SsuD/methylene tetrahydromethanopterin reductase-like flavin-dependent oxidoreductase (luciferase family)
MRFGLFGGAARGAHQTGDSQSYRQFIDYVVEAEQLGFESVFLVEHHFTGAGQLSASLTLLSYLAGLTSTMRLGTGVTVMPWHNPVLLAEQAATVDLVSNGRLDFGVGKGYRPNEFHGFRIDPSEAAARFEEALELVLRSWTTKERFSHEGRYWRFRDVIVEPHPVQAPHPPVWVAAQAEASIRAAARKGQRLLLDQFGSAELTAQRVGWYRDELAQHGRAFESGMVAVTRGLLLIDSNDSAKRQAEIEKRIAAIRMLQETARVPGDTTPFKPQTGLMSDSREANEAAVIIGPPEECIERLRRLEKAGVDYVLFNDPWGGIDRLRFFAREVMPEFRSSNSNRLSAARTA